jgi:hypothetical protein
MMTLLVDPWIDEQRFFLTGHNHSKEIRHFVWSRNDPDSFIAHAIEESATEVLTK